jgi:hypothetical protein
MISRGAMLGAFAGLALWSSGAGAVDQNMLGAWTQSAADCAATFQRSGGSIRFRQPVDEFKTAFIITANKIQTTTGVCKIVKSTMDKDTWTVSMTCNNSIGYYDRKAKLKVDGNTLTYGFPGNESLDVRFEKCPL